MYKTPLEVWTTRYITMKVQAKTGRLHSLGFKLFYQVIDHLNERCPGMIGWLDHRRAQKDAAEAKRKADRKKKIKLAEDRKKAEVLRQKKAEEDRKVAEVKAKEVAPKLEEVR